MLVIYYQYEIMISLLLVCLSVNRIIQKVVDFHEIFMARTLRL